MLHKEPSEEEKERNLFFLNEDLMTGIRAKGYPTLFDPRISYLQGKKPRRHIHIYLERVVDMYVVILYNIIKFNLFLSY